MRRCVAYIPSYYNLMCFRYARRSRKFMDAYHKGLTASQAAWAAKKYRGHRVLPETLMLDIEKANLT